jgi:hypothetical protein
MEVPRSRQAVAAGSASSSAQEFPISPIHQCLAPANGPAHMISKMISRIIPIGIDAALPE